jgi:glucosamine--fructose-6-phosphate aminotransferase (isomerizing)
MSLFSEIYEQGNILEGLLSRQMSTVEEIARSLRKHNPPFVFLAARGTSDNAGRYANYILGSHNRLPVALATPSLFSIYNQPPKLNGALVVGISQSGQSPDIVSVLTEARAQGSPTLAITNAPDSPLGQSADWVINIQAGVEAAVAATKTYTSQLMAIAMLSAALSGERTAYDSLSQVPGWVRQVLERSDRISHMADRYRYMQHCVVLGRGYNYATAYEWALKLKELTYVIAEPYSSADFQHGPIAIVEQGFPIMAVAVSGQIFGNTLEILHQLRRGSRAELVVISDELEALEIANTPLPLPVGIPEWLSPIPAIIPAQLFTHALTRARGLDTEAPRSIRKVTETQ